MRLGLIAREDSTGLGYQTKAYHKFLRPDKTLVVDLSDYNQMKQNHWYDEAIRVKGFPTVQNLEFFLQDLDVVLTAETPYNYELYNLAKAKGVKVYNVVNWEFFDHHINPKYPLPYGIIMPSTWYLKDAKKFGADKGVEIHHLHHPVDRSEIEYTHRTRGVPFHIAGKPAAHDRNGTMDFLRAIPDGRVVTQSDDFARQIGSRFRHARIKTNVENYSMLYQVGDILVFPRRYGGNCLPLNEALAAGCPVIMPDISPNNHLLPKEWLVRANVKGSFTPRTRIDIHESDIDHIRERVNYIQNNIENESKKANQIAESISWEVMLEKWLNVLYL